MYKHYIKFLNFELRAKLLAAWSVRSALWRFWQNLWLFWSYILDYYCWKMPYIYMDMIYGKYITQLAFLGIYIIRYIFLFLQMHFHTGFWLVHSGVTYWTPPPSWWANIVDVTLDAFTRKQLTSPHQESWFCHVITLWI